MDLLGDALAPYSDALGKFAGSITCLQFLSGVFLLNDIRQQGSSDKYPPEVFIGGLVLSALSLKLGAIMGDEALMVVNIFGIFISILFTYGFFYYASAEYRAKIWSKLAIAGVFIMACLAYANFEDAEKVEVRLGVLITLILVYLVGAPLLNLGEIIQKQSTEGLPFPIILAGNIVAASWTTYGISIKNSVMTYQNILLFVLSGIQLALFAIYPSKPSGKSKEAISSPKKTNASKKAD